MNLSVRKGEFVTILGPSGCGKTTLLRLIAGFQTASEGVITIAGEDITQTPPHRRPVNTVVQKYALFPHLNVFNNIAFGLKLKKLPPPLSKRKWKQALRMVGMTDYEDRDVDSLSGGQQQRVAIARAIVNEPEVLLLDEPLCRPRPEDAQGHADGTQRDAPEAGHHLRIRHPRPGRGPHPERHHRRDERRQDTANRHSDRHLQRAYQLLRSRLHRREQHLNGVMVHDRLARFCEHEFDCVDTGFGDRTGGRRNPSGGHLHLRTLGCGATHGNRNKLHLQRRALRNAGTDPRGLRADGAGLPLLRGRPRSGSAGKTFRHPRNEERTHLQHFRGQAPGRNTRGIPGLQLRMQSGARHRSRNARNGGSGLPKRYPGG